MKGRQIRRLRAASSSSPTSAKPSASSFRYRHNPGGDIVTSILAGVAPWSQNACLLSPSSRQDLLVAVAV